MIESCKKCGTGTYSLHPKTAQEALERWDKGELVFTIEMGGLGPGYEQCIHITVFEIIRALVDKPLPEDGAKLEELLNNAIFHSQRCSELRLSGVQAGAAKNLAYRYLRDGWAATLETVGRDRHIQVAKFFQAQRRRRRSHDRTMQKMR